VTYEIITSVGAVVGIINSFIFLLFLASKRVRRFIIRITVSDLIIDLAQDGHFQRYVDILCTVYEVTKAKATGRLPKDMEIKEVDD